MGATLNLNFYIGLFIFSTEMVESMKKVAKSDTELSVEERNLLSVAYKNVIGARRASWRIVSSLEQKDEGKVSEEKQLITKQYRIQVSLTFFSFFFFFSICSFLLCFVIHCSKFALVFFKEPMEIVSSFKVCAFVSSD